MKEIGKPFEDLNTYNNSMSKAMEDKLFFADKLPKDKRYMFIDFGCADGVMIKHLINIYGNDCYYVGYDCSATMIDIAKTNYDLDCSRVMFTSEWDDVSKILTIKDDFNYTTVLILSSVIHEVYSYAESKTDIDTFWDRVRNTGFDYIVIRDMMARKSMERMADATNVNKVYSKASGFQLSDFTRLHGSIDLQINLIHFLLKYRWKINWEREVNENYFPICLEDLLQIIKEPPYMLTYLENFKVKFLEDRIYEDFGITISDNTHIKLIFKRV